MTARLALSAMLLLLLSPGSAPLLAAGNNPHADIRSFLRTYCIECHGPEKQKGDRRFDQLALPVDKIDGLIDLQDILDQLNLGDMPPKKAKKPGKEELAGAITMLTQSVADAQVKFASTGGQAILRRLNRREYLNTVGDLFGINMLMFDPTTKFPRDQTVAHMDNIGDTLRTSSYLLDQYLEAADLVVEKSFSQLDRPAEQQWSFNGNFQQQPELSYSHGKVYNFRYLCMYESMSSPTHEGGYGPIHGFTAGVPADGYYEIQVHAQSLNRKNPYNPAIFRRDPEEPFRLGIVPGNQLLGPLHHSQVIEPQLAEVVVRDEAPEWYTMRVWLDKGFTPRFIFPNGMADCRKAFQQILSKHRNMLPPEAQDAQGIVLARYVTLKYGYMPHIRIDEITIRGPLYDQWPIAGPQAVLGGKAFDPGLARQTLERFAGRAYRRPAAADEVDRLMAVYQKRISDGKSPLDALKDAMKVALCSPAFLYIAQPDAAADPKQRKLPAHALASRLSYFIWSSMPDEELLAAARSGELLKDEVLLAQARRLLASPRSNAFIQGFCDSWLNLRSLGDMPPDRDAFERYYTQDLQAAMKTETQLFTRDLIERDDSILRFIDADYTFMNRALARLYGMPDAVPVDAGGEFRKVKISDPNRGGLLGQGSVLTVSANGVETSPVTRGIWLLENILGTPPAPPPDNVPPIDPDIRGAKSMREILTRHRDNPTCFECHQKIDPLGFALENFDPIGAWRDQYHKNLPVDSSGQLPGGESFKDLAGLKKILAGRKEQFARMLTERLLSYACGRRIEPVDRPQITRIVNHVKQGHEGFRSLIEQAVLSETFRCR